MPTVSSPSTRDLVAAARAELGDEFLSVHPFTAEALTALLARTHSSAAFEQCLIASSEWQARAESAERGVQHRERLLRTLTDAVEAEGRTVIAVALEAGGDRTSMSLHGPAAFEDDLCERWGKAIGLWLRVLDCSLREVAGLKAGKQRDETLDGIEDG